MRLYRPHIPVEVRCRVALRQLGEMWPDERIAADKPLPGDAYLKKVGAFVSRRGLQVLLDELLGRLADLLGCAVEELRLDHDPALALREKKLVGLTGRWRYYPDANDPLHLLYRPHGAQHHGSHDTKTRIRGEHGQFSDLALIRRAKLRERKAQKRKGKLRKRKMLAPKLKSAGQWPPRGSRKIKSRKSWPSRIR